MKIDFGLHINKAGIVMLIGLMGVVGLYFGCVAYVLRYKLDSTILPNVLESDSAAPVAARLTDTSGNELLLRRYGQPLIGCAIFFPGQHGELSSYQQTLFRRLADAGVAVFAVAYPGQNGAAGTASIRKMLDLSRRAVLLVTQRCSQRRTIILGRSLGAMVAVYAAEGANPAAIVVDSTAPSLSVAIAVRFRSRWYLYPLAFLPIHALLPHDYSLAEALAHSPGTPLVVFQGTADHRTPIRDLNMIGDLPAQVRLVPVPRATHANTYRVALEAYIATVVDVLTNVQRKQAIVAK